MDRSWIPGMSPGSVSANLLLKMKAVAAAAVFAAGGEAHSGPVLVWSKRMTGYKTFKKDKHHGKVVFFFHTTVFTFAHCFAAKPAGYNTG